MGTASSPPAPRLRLLDIYRAALAAVNGERCVREALSSVTFDEDVAVVAIGKAADSMLQGALAALATQVADVLCVGKERPGAAADARGRYLQAGHPLPDERSLAAGAALLDFIHRQPAGRPMLFLLSGGASALVEVLPDGVGLDDLQRVNAWLLASGWPIDAMNPLRKSLSCIKGGRLAQRLAGRPVLNLMISDVPGDAPHVIGSGLLVADPAAGPAGFAPPGWIRELQAHAPPAPTVDDACFRHIDTRIVANLDRALRAAADAADGCGVPVILHREFLGGDARATGVVLARQLCESPPALHIWGGETTVSLPSEPGRGGRNQQLALAAACGLAGRDGHWLLAAGTDGSDGPTDDAGALVDGGTLARGRNDGGTALACAETALERADAGGFLARSGDLIRTGPTGTNVMDLVLALRLPADKNH